MKSGKELRFLLGRGYFKVIGIYLLNLGQKSQNPDSILEGDETGVEARSGVALRPVRWRVAASHKTRPSTSATDCKDRERLRPSRWKFRCSKLLAPVDLDASIPSKRCSLRAETTPEP